jgi:D-beta-D-heptose 7-phosphate kinase/D-beta-D-heptose 1-phosphate adenosyltransferase
MIDSAVLFDALDRLGSPRLLVLGDLMLDRTTWGDVDRVSPEAPALVLRPDVQEARPGGAAAVAALLQALGASVSLAGVIGCDADGRTLRGQLRRAGVDVSLVCCDVRRPTTAKERLIARGPGRPQHLLRVDREACRSLDSELQNRLGKDVIAALPTFQAVLISDYGKGVCTTRLLARVLEEARRQDIPVFVDPAFLADWERYRGAAMLLPNRREAQLADGMTITGPEDALVAGRRLAERYDAGAVLVKLDRDGMVLMPRGGPGQVFPARARQVDDVTGAGDMVLAVVGLCRASGLGWDETMTLAAVAAAWEVGQSGVAPLTRAGLRAEVLRVGAEAATRQKLVSTEEMEALARDYRRAGRTLVFTNGCFDLLHAGHVACLEEAARLGDVLVVGLNTDRSVRRLKGAGRPVVGAADRAALLAALGCVGHVILFDEETPHQLLERLRPEVLVKGGTTAEVVGREVVESYGGRVCIVAHKPGLSTTVIVTTVRARTAEAEL